MSAVQTNIRAIQALARETWGLLTLAQRSVLRRASITTHTPAIRLHNREHRRTSAALLKHGLIDDDEYLTGLGLLVRDEGIAVDATAARRRYSRRKRRAS